jgi:uncharacterized protein
MIDGFRTALWRAGWPARMLLVLLIRGYRVALVPMFGGHCRFHPSCSAYAEGAIRNVGAMRGAAMAGWRILRCSPLTSGGVEYPPAPRGRPSRPMYDAAIHLKRSRQRKTASARPMEGAA